MARSATVACAETPSHSRGPGYISVTLTVSFTTGVVRSAILATAGLLVQTCVCTVRLYACKLTCKFPGGLHALHAGENDSATWLRKLSIR